MLLVLGLVWARLRDRPLRAALVVLGLALATAVPVVAQGSAVVVAAQSLRHAVTDLPAGQRSLIVSYPGVVLPDKALASLDATSRRALGQLTSVPAHRQLLFRRIADTRGGSFFLGAADDLLSQVRLTSGRAPASCTPTRCEVVVLGLGTPAPDPTLGLVVVGRAVRTDPLLLSGTFDPGHDAPLLLADGVAAAQRLAALEQFQRSIGWVTPLDLGHVLRLGVDDYVALSASVTDQLYALDEGLVLTAPDSALQTARDRTELSAGRFTLLSGAGTALLLGFAVIAALGLRRDQLALVDLLRRRGATRALTRTLVVTEAASAVAAGSVLGLTVGALAAAALAGGAGLPAAATAGAAVAACLVATATLAVLATAVVVATCTWGQGARSRTVWRVLDGVVVAGLATSVLAVGRGAVGASALSAGTDPLLTALPVIAVVCGGLLAARAWPWLAATAGRHLPHRLLAARLGLLGAAHRPLRPVATVAFLTAATAIVVFAGAYRATLAQGALDQAVFAVPLDARLTTGLNLERPLDVVAPAEVASAAPGASVHDVLRAGAQVRVSSSESTAADVVGVDPAALPLIRSWDHVAGGMSAAGAATLIRWGEPPVGTVVPAGTTSVTVTETGDVAQVQLVAWFREPDGRDLGVPMTQSPGGLRAALRPLSWPVRMFALTLAESPGYATRHQHAIGEGVTDKPVLAGRVSLGPAVFTGAGPGAAVAAGWAGWGVDAGRSASAAQSGGRLAVSYAFTGDLVVVRAAAAGPGRSPILVPVLVDPATAARATSGVLQLTGTGSAAYRLQIVGTLPRFPTVGASFVVVDAAALADALDAAEPGSGAVDELWVAAPDRSVTALDAALALPPYDRLTVALRSQQQRDLAVDPVAVGAQTLLVASALLALGVAALALVLLVVSERRDDSAELYAWESDGVAPATLRWSLFLRALAVAMVALPCGLATGLLLSQVTTTLVALTAVGTAPSPPLVLSVGARWVAAALAVGLAVAVAACAVVASGALREPLPRRPVEDLR